MSKPQRKPRFRRDNSVRFKLNERDVKIIEAVYKHRFLNTDQIVALIGGSRQVICRRLNYLFHGAYLDRPLAQLGVITNKPMVYALGNQGALLLAQKYDYPISSLDWASKNREAKAVFLEHTLMVAQFMIMIELACKKVKGLEFISPEEIITNRPIPAPSTAKSLSWKVDTKLQGKNCSFSITPDSVFGLHFTTKRKKAFFFLEADRSTMPIHRTSLHHSSFYKKMLGYWQSWTQKLYSHYYGFSNPRILTLTISQERINSMIAANKKQDPKGLGLRMFLFAPETVFDLSKPEIVLTQAWINGREEKVSLVD